MSGRTGASTWTSWVRRPDGLALSGAVGVFMILSALLWSYVVDDMFISLRYARHLVEGHGLVYNIGERVEGYTNLLWTLLLAGAHFLPGDVVAWTKLLSLAAALVAAWGTARLAAASGLVPPDWAWLPAALWLTLPLTAVSAAEGLETMLFAALLVGSLVASVEGRGPLTGALLAALTLTRPDGLIVAPLALGWIAWRHSAAAALRGVAVLMPVLGAVEVWRVTYYGEWLPNTFYAKAGGDWRLTVIGARSFLAFWAIAGAGAWLLAVPALRHPAARWLAVVVASRLAFHLWSGGPWMGEHRFLVPIVPVVLVVVIAGLLTLTRRGLAVAVVSLLFVLPGWATLPGTLRAMRAYGHGVETGYRPLGLWLNETLPPGAVLACGDAGAIAYYANRTAIDILGLNDYHIARQPGRFSAEKQDASYVLSRAPDAIILLAGSPGGGDWITRADAAIATHPDFGSLYVHAGSWQHLAQYHLVLYLRVPTTGRTGVD